MLAKGFLQSEVLCKVYVLEEAVRGEVFGEVWGEVFGEVFGLVCLDIQSRNNKIQLISSPKLLRLCAQQNWRNFREKLHDEVLQVDHPQENVSGLRNWGGFCGHVSETGRIWFRGVRFQTPNSVSFLGLTEFWGANSVSSSRPIICVPKRTHRV